MWCAQCGNSAVSRLGEVCSQCRSAEYDGPDMEEPRVVGEEEKDEEGFSIKGNEDL